MPDRIDELTAEKQPEQEEIERRRLDAWLSVLDTREGRVVLKDLMEVTNFGISAFAGNGELTLVNAGKQMIGEHVMAMVNSTFPESYFLMLKESKEDEDYDRTERDTSPNTNDSTDSGTSSDTES